MIEVSKIKIIKTTQKIHNTITNKNYSIYKRVIEKTDKPIYGLWRNKMLKDLGDSQKVIVFDKFVEKLQKINSNGATIYGTVQLLETLEEIAVLEGFLICPYCKRRN